MAKVYIKIDKNNCITGVESDLTLKDATEYVQIDEGNGDKYVHAQNNYFPEEKPLRDIQGRCNYKYIDSKVIELTKEEKESLFLIKEPQPSREEILEQQLLQTQAQIANLQEQILLNNGGTK